MKAYQHKSLIVKLSPKGEKRLYMRISYNFKYKRLYLRSISLRKRAEDINAKVIIAKDERLLDGSI